MSSVECRKCHAPAGEWCLNRHSQPIEFLVHPIRVIDGRVAYYEDLRRRRRFREFYLGEWLRQYGHIFKEN